ncbi:hypothetical protein WN944_023777 [Citrus x changshan-huyou]|uniref:Uncharacterized protein n=1 Tax=Citrus x changshan-huyou TaxID=2935761 RepID=A0AAP0LMP4_9ROSI
MSFNTIADVVSTYHLVNAIQFSASRSGFGAMLSAVYGFKIKSGLFDGVDSVIEDWIVDQMHIVFEGLTVEGILKNWSKIKPMIVKDWSENIDARFNLFGKVRGSQLWGINIYTDDFDLVAGYCLPTASPPLSAIQELRATIWCYLCKIKGGGTIDLEPCLTHSSTVEPTLAPMAVERTMTTRAAASVLESASVAGLFRWLTQAVLLVDSGG